MTRKTSGKAAIADTYCAKLPWKGDSPSPIAGMDGGQAWANTGTPAPSAAGVGDGVNVKHGLLVHTGPVQLILKSMLNI